MDWTVFKDLVSNFGFPIVMCVGLCIYIWKKAESYQKELAALKQEYKEDMKAMREHYESKLAEINKEHKEEVSKMAGALDNNTAAIERLTDRLEEERRLKYELQKET